MENFTSKLAKTLKTINGTAIASINTRTPVKLTGGKKNPMQGRVTKVAEKQNIMLFSNKNGSSYNTMVKKRLVKEGKNPDTFKLGKRTWGSRIPETPLVSHKETLYLETIFLKAPKNVTYLLDGAPIEKSDITGFPVKKDGAQGGLSDKVIIRTFKLENICAFNCGELSVL